MSSITTDYTNDNTVRGELKKKNGYHRLVKGAYKPLFITQVEQNIIALSLGNLKDASMVSIDSRSLEFKLRIGLGKKNEYVENDWHDREEYCGYETVEETIEGLQGLLRLAKQGEFDDALNKLLEKRQSKAFKMIEARQSNGEKPVDVRFLAAAE